MPGPPATVTTTSFAPAVPAGVVVVMVVSLTTVKAAEAAPPCTPFAPPIVTALAPVKRGAAEKTEPAAPIKGGRETILLVEDESPVRELVREILLQYQYRVIEAASGVEALKQWEAEDGKVDLLLTDMVMPEGINGRELATQLRTRKPELKVVFTSGYSPEIVGKSFSQGDTTFIQKPYQPLQLAQRVRETLDAPRKVEALELVK